MVGNLNIHFKGENLAITVPCKYDKIKSEELKDKLKVQAYVNDKKAFYKSIGVTGPKAYSKSWVDETGKVVDKAEVKFFANIDGKLEEVEQYERTMDFEIMGLSDAEQLNKFIVEDCYELFTDNKNIPDLWKIVQYLQEKNKIAIGKFSFGNGFKLYMGILKPVIKDDKFVLELDLATQTKNYKRLMDTKANKEAKKKTLDMLAQTA